MSRTLPSLATLLAAATVAAAPGMASTETSGGARAEVLPLGRAGLPETREVTELARGVRHVRIVRGAPSARSVFTVDVAFLATRREAVTVAARLRAAGQTPRIKRIATRAPDDPGRGPLGYLVSVGSFGTAAEADARRAELTAAGFTGLRTVNTGEDGGTTSGPWVVNVLQVDPDRFDGLVAPELGTEIVPELERLSAIAARTDALAAVNGGYFVIGAADGTPGDLAGVSVIDGDLVSEAVSGRTSLILPGAGRAADVARVETALTVAASDGATRELDGLNRAPGLIRACGGSGGDLPTEAPLHDFTCTDASELIRYTADFGTTTPAGEGVEVTLDAAGLVGELRAARGGPIPADGAVLAATGDAASWLLDHAAGGTTLDVRAGLTADGAPLALDGALGVVNGGPRLLERGRLRITAAAEGFVGAGRAEFYYRFGVRRNPRTLAGVRRDGTLLLVTVDGRQPGVSVGASFRESALILQSLGAREGVNLDGGGSTTMTIGDEVVNRTSDATGERPIGDAIVLLAG